ncbi:RDD family protein [Candidatus Avelusimicrobium fimicolum]|uniref:RDD family protein n=1 Tax=Candidatus Avelusimicrobium fimicolum TaxID=3416216 RepID=UPI003CA167E7|nr:RDD family protein [Spirochaetia bacterium]
MYAGIGKRFFAFLIDVLFFAVLYWVLWQMMKSYATVSLVLLVIIWLYYALLESSPLQASIGKILMGIKVVDRRGRRLSFWQATERIVSKLVTNVTFYFGFFVAAWDKKKRTLHDRISHSAVILKSAEFDPDSMEEEDEEASLTWITLVSVALAIVFVLLLLWGVALPQYQHTERYVQLTRVLAETDEAARAQVAAASRPGVDPREWQVLPGECLKIGPQKLSCRGFDLVLERGGIQANARTGAMDIIYTLYYPFGGGPLTCTPRTPQGQEICSTLKK